MNKIENQISQMIKMGVISFVGFDTTAYPQVQVSYNGKTSNAVRLSPYGLVSNPPTGSFTLLFSANGQESVKFALTADMINRLKGLKEGECALFNCLTGSYVLLNENGDVIVLAKGDLIATVEGSASIEAAVTLTLKAPTIILDGDVTGPASAPVEMINDVKIGSLTFNAHKHDGVTTGAGTSGTPV